MINLIASALGREEEIYGQQIELILGNNKEHLSKQEIGMLTKLLEDRKTTGTYSHPEAFKREFPELRTAIDAAKNILPDEVKHYTLALVEKRVRQRTSQELMVIANNVLDRGLTYDDIDKIRSLPLNEEAVEDEEPDSFKARYLKRKEQPLGIQTGIQEIDSMLGGIPKGFVTTLFAWTGSYKTTTAVNMFYKNSIKNGYNQVYISLEVPKEDILFNLLCMHSNDPKFSKYPFINHDRIRKGLLNEEEEDYLLNVIEPDLSQYMDRMIILDETDFKTFTFGEITSKLEEVDDKIPGGIDVIYWDHANLFKFSTGPQKNMAVGETINAYISFIRRLSIRFRRSKENPNEWRKLANVVLAQSNRTGWQRAVKNSGRYSLTAISEANEMERASAYIIAIYTSEDMKISREASFQLLKSRYGQTIYEPINTYADPERYLVGDEGEAGAEVSDSMFDSMMSVNPSDFGFSGDLDLDEFDVG